MADSLQQAREARASLVAAVRAHGKNGMSNVSDDRIWQAWVDTSASMKTVPANLEPFVPRNADGQVMIDSAMVAAQLVIDVMEGRF